MTSVRFDRNKPQVLDMRLAYTHVSDAIDFVNLGINTEYRLWEQKISPIRLGTTKNFNAQDYSIVKAQLLVDSDLTVISRNSYSLLNLLGDCGGLECALAWLGAKIVGFFISFYATAEIISLMYWKRPPTTKLPEDISKEKTTYEIKEEMIREFN